MLKDKVVNKCKQIPLMRSAYICLKFELTKGKLRQLWHFIFHGHFCRHQTIRRYLEGTKCRCLQIGGGFHKKTNWLNGDLIAGEIYVNAKRRLPFSDETFDYIFAEQFIEHLDIGYGEKCLIECFRVLKENGRIRFSTPDLAKLIQLYSNINSEVKLKTAIDRHKNNHNKKVTTPAHFLNDFFRLWGHSFIYDEETLRLILKQAGFRNIIRHQFGQSDDQVFKNVERHAETDWMKNAFNLILEGEKKLK